MKGFSPSTPPSHCCSDATDKSVRQLVGGVLVIKRPKATSGGGILAREVGVGRGRDLKDGTGEKGAHVFDHPVLRLL